MFSSGFAYGKGAVLAPKKIMYSITTGGAGNKEEFDYYQSKVDGLYQDVFGFIGWEILPPFIAHGVQKKSHNERFQMLNDYKKHISHHITLAKVSSKNEQISHF